MVNRFYRNRLSTMLLVWFIVASSCMVVTGDKKRDDLGQLVGYVTDMAGKPLVDAVVRVYFHGTYREDISDASGYYEVTDIPLCYCLKNCTCSKEGYLTEWVLMAIGINTSYSFVLYPEELYPVLDPPEPTGANGWYTTPVTVSFSYNPNEVAAIFYDYNGGHQYQEPFSIAEDCFIGSIWYYWIDFSGEQSPMFSFDLNMDLVPPSIEMSWEKAGMWSKDIIFTATINDDCSAPDYVEFYLNDVLQFTDKAPPYAWQITHTSQNYMIKACAYDLAGNMMCDTINGSEIHIKNMVLDGGPSSRVSRVLYYQMVYLFTILVQKSLDAFGRQYPSH